MISDFIKLHEVHENCESTLLALRKDNVEAVYTEDGETHIETESSEFVVEESVEYVIEQLDYYEPWD